MAKKRVNELAREHDIPAKEVVAKLQAAGIEVKASASAVDEDMALAALAGKPLPRAGNGKATPAKPEVAAPSRPPRAPRAPRDAR
ncbi:MAG: translation initiation factor IF-2 N-terminal domain-containing protein, partial [Solirubrobacterales bacterium]|nr:translation initiation factor IF-2 N-terminal domain-containing protein [Solirubrobacterales bacterium]